MLYVQVLHMNEHFAAPTEQKMTKAFCVVAVAAVLIATLWPFNPFPRNGVTWLKGTSGIKFEKAGLVTSNEPLRPVETRAPESYTLELLLRPAGTKSASTILALDTPTRPRELLVRQSTDGLVVTHDETVENDRTQSITFYVAQVFRPGRFVLVTISSGPDGTSVYLDGQPAQSFPRFRISRSDLSSKIVLGNSPVEYNPWPGELGGLSIYSKELTSEEALRRYKEWTNQSSRPDFEGAIFRYVFAEGAGREVRNEVASGPNLQIPVTFSVPHKDMLQSAAKEFRANSTYVTDLLTNIAGFVPLGLIGSAYLSWTRSRWKAIVFATVACGMLSFVIEVLQYYIPRRGSGMTDIITNTLGAALGAMLLQVGAVRRALEHLKLIPRTCARRSTLPTAWSR